MSSSSEFIRSGYEVYPPRPEHHEVHVFLDAAEVEWYVNDTEREGYEVIGLVFADARAEEKPTKIGCLNVVESKASAVEGKVMEELSEEARKLGADGIFDVSVDSYSGTCRTGTEEENCARAYGMATAIRFTGSG
jgi:uncharacterized protein YbjQ (UPF0145 family)